MLVFVKVLLYLMKIDQPKEKPLDDYFDFP